MRNCGCKRNAVLSSLRTCFKSQNSSLLSLKEVKTKKLKKMKTAEENDYAANYVKPGSMKLSVSRDLFLYSRITKTERPKSSSGTHTSSSGRTHGGRGGSF